jgi:hypothetical protein
MSAVGGPATIVEFGLRRWIIVLGVLLAPLMETIDSYDWTRVLAPRTSLALTWRPSWPDFPSFGATLSVRASGEDTLLVRLSNERACAVRSGNPYYSHRLEPLRLGHLVRHLLDPRSPPRNKVNDD